MADFAMPGCAQDNDACLRDAVCVHTRKIFDSCRDKDCAEDLRFYPAQGCQEVIDKAISIKPGTAELLYVYIDVEPVGFNRGYYTVDARYFYKVTADAFVGAACPVTICGSSRPTTPRAVWTNRPLCGAISLWPMWKPLIPSCST